MLIWRVIIYGSFPKKKSPKIGGVSKSSILYNRKFQLINPFSGTPVPPLESVERTGIQHFPRSPRLLRPDLRGRWVRFGEPFGRHDGPRKSALVVVALLGGAQKCPSSLSRFMTPTTRVYGNEWYTVHI